MDIEDEAYHSGLTLPGASEEFKEKSKQSELSSAGKQVQGSKPTAGTPPKERTDMNIGDKLHSAGRRPFDKPPSTADPEGAIKVASVLSQPKSLTTPNAMTPTSHLASQFGSINFKGAMESKFAAQADSPTSDYASGNFSSLAESDRGYASMPSMPSMTSLEKLPQNVQKSNPALEKPVLIATDDGYMGEEMDVDRIKASSPDGPVIITTAASKIDIQDTSTLLTGKVSTRTPSETSSETSSLSPAPLSMLHSPAIRSESPASVPAIAEDIEIVTESVLSPFSERLRQEGVSSKRSAESDLGPSTKTPRLSPGALGMSFIFPESVY